MKPFAALIIALPLSPLAVLHAATPARPNILHTHADVHRADGLHAPGNDLFQTPDLNMLAERGMTFMRCGTMDREMTSHADAFPLKVAAPAPAEWTPPAAGKRANQRIKPKSKE